MELSQLVLRDLGYGCERPIRCRRRTLGNGGMTLGSVPLGTLLPRLG